MLKNKVWHKNKFDVYNKSEFFKQFHLIPPFMPGFQFSYIKDVNAKHSDGRIESSQKTCYQQQPFYLSSRANADYPIISWVENDFQILFEGIIYDSSTEVLRQKIQAFCAQQITAEQIQKWLHQCDGEFVLLILNTQNQQLWLWNDVFGRLPVYLFQESGKLLIGRAIQHIRAISGSKSFDTYGLATTLLFGFALGEQSLWEGISYLPPGVLLKADFKTNKLFISKGFEAYRFGSAEPPNPKVWIESLSSALENRLKKLPNMALSLSGGLDSRLIAALLKKMEVNIPAYTYQDAEGSASADVQAVKQMVSQLDWESQHKFIPLEPTNIAQIQELMQLKQGINYAGMAFLLPFLGYFSQQHLAMITGDGGDKLLADLHPLLRLRNQNQLLKYLLRKHGRSQLETAARWSGISVKALTSYLLAHLETYQESPEKAYSQFLLRERGRKWLFEGEDRNREFCWSTTPFYEPSFARQALAVRMSDKAFGKLFLQLFRQLPGSLEQIVNPNWQQPLDRQKAIQQLYRRQQIKQRLIVLPWLENLLSDKSKAKVLHEINVAQLANLADYGLKINSKELNIIKNVDLQVELFGLALLTNSNSG
ncbi:MAG: asparagine synthase-related protein [Bacteroidales bacterium]|nr:asparagine synthase-related protein [Bacteroidales bacterium]